MQNELQLQERILQVATANSHLFDRIRAGGRAKGARLVIVTNQRVLLFVPAHSSNSFENAELVAFRTLEDDECPSFPTGVKASLRRDYETPYEIAGRVVFIVRSWTLEQLSVEPTKTDTPRPEPETVPATLVATSNVAP